MAGSFWLYRESSPGESDESACRTGSVCIHVTDGGPAIAAGLHGTSETVTQDGRNVEVGGDIITAIDGQPVKTFDDILVYLTLNTSPGQEVMLTILRDGKYQDIPLKLGTRPTD